MNVVVVCILMVVAAAGSSHGQQVEDEDPRATLNLIFIGPTPAHSFPLQDEDRMNSVLELVVEENGSYACRQSQPTLTPAGSIAVSSSSNSSSSSSSSSSSRRCRVGILEAVLLALERVNENGSILRDHRLTLTPFSVQVSMDHTFHPVPEMISTSP